jgi:hypothetical protein
MAELLSMVFRIEELRGDVLSFKELLADDDVTMFA